MELVVIRYSNARNLKCIELDKRTENGRGDHTGTEVLDDYVLHTFNPAQLL